MGRDGARRARACTVWSLGVVRTEQLFPVVRSEGSEEGKVEY
jgi:hypothetical protein